ncbi:MAG: hldD [Firmicutes bacterium]|nr:hldD [Bacillota bacterium]
MIVVTGGAGFIGSNLVKTLNDRGIDDILIVDHLKDSSKMENMRGLKFFDYLDKSRFLSRIEQGGSGLGGIDAIFHIGACSDTMELDGSYMLETNYEYSKILLHYCLAGNIPFQYSSSASVYGNGDAGFREEPACEHPLNVYAYSKFLFDNYVRRLKPPVGSQVVGLRYFNVFGPQENHKGRMASIAYQLYNQLKKDGVARLFAGTEGYGDGEQRRDFIYVQDVVRVHLFFHEHPEVSGVFNCGTGTANTFNAVARALIARLGSGRIEYVPFPAALAGKYQSFTQADPTQLRAAGWNQEFTSLAEAVAQYCDCLESTGGYLR